MFADLLHCHTQFVSRLRQADESDEGGRLPFQVINSICESSVQSFRAVSYLLANLTENDVEELEDLRGWQTTFLWSIQTLFYPLRQATQNNRNNNSNLDHWDTNASNIKYFTEVIQKGGLAAMTILELYIDSPTSQQNDWLLVLLVELVRRQALPVDSNFYEQISALFIETHRERSRNLSGGSTKRKSPLAAVMLGENRLLTVRKIKLLGTLLLETWSSLAPISPLDPGMMDSESILDALSTYMDTVIQSTRPKFVEVPSPRSSSSSPSSKTPESLISLVIDRGVVVRFVESLSSSSERGRSLGAVRSSLSRFVKAVGSMGHDEVSTGGRAVGWTFLDDATFRSSPEREVDLEVSSSGS